MGAEVALLGRVVVGVDEDRVIGTRGDARLAADADRLVEVHDPVRTPVHRRGRAGVDAGRIVALVAAGDLEAAPGGRVDAHVDRLDIGAGDRQRHLVLRLAGGRAGVAADAPRLVDDLGPEGRQGLSAGHGTQFAQ